MPEGHSVHRIARQFQQNFVGQPLAVSSPQGRFAEGAARIDGRTLQGANAVGKQLFLDFDELTMRVHLGIYGAWDFAGEITADATLLAANGRAGQTGMHGVAVDEIDDEVSLRSIGAPRRARVRLGEQSIALVDEAEFPPPPVGQVRARLLAPQAVADLRGPTVCEIITPLEVDQVLARLGPDPLAPFESPAQARARFTDRVLGAKTPIALLLMDQSVVAGIGNVYRAELLFRARIEPHRPGRELSMEQARGLWADWSKLLKIGVDTGLMLTMDGLRGARREAAIRHRDDRHWVYHRAGLPCRLCGTPIALEELGGRKLYWCPSCQV